MAITTSTGGEQPGLSPRRYYIVTFGVSRMLDDGRANDTIDGLASPAGVTRHSDRHKRALFADLECVAFAVGVSRRSPSQLGTREASRDKETATRNSVTRTGLIQPFTHCGAGLIQPFTHCGAGRVGALSDTTAMGAATMRSGQPEPAGGVLAAAGRGDDGGQAVRVA
ncbi:MAG TPA: hypothetical protein VF086_20345 [Propionibacteriaceae bacterium]